MSTDAKGILAQILVGVVTGILVGILAGSGTAYVMVNRVDKKLDMYISSNEAKNAQLEKDIAKLENNDLIFQSNFSNMNNSMSSIATNVAVITERLKQWEPTPHK